MASEKNITMRQYNGVDYDTLYPKTKVEQVEGAYTQQQILSDSTKTLFGLETGAVPDEAFVALKNLINGISASSIGAARIELGNYTGTGANANTAITLTFSFKPKVVIVAGPGNNTSNKSGTAVFMQGAVYSKTDTGSGGLGGEVYGWLVALTWSGNSVTWKGIENIKGESILNMNNAKYYYVAIG